MSKKSVFCIATSRELADRIVDQLKGANFANNDISALFVENGRMRDFAHEKRRNAPSGTATGAATGGFLGGALGWIAGIAALAIPGVGPFVAAGPVIGVLSGAAVGAALGGIAGGLIDLGVPEMEAKRFEGRIQTGEILVSVHTQDAEGIGRAEGIFKQADAHDICTVVDPLPLNGSSPAGHGPQAGTSGRNSIRP